MLQYRRKLHRKQRRRSSGFGRGTPHLLFTGSTQFKALRGVDAGTPTRVINGTMRLADKSGRDGTPRQMQPGRCYNFDGTADRVTAPYTLAAFPASVSLWYRAANLTGAQTLFAFTEATGANAWQALNLNGSSSYQMLRHDNGGAHSASFAVLAPVATTWTHVCIVLTNDTEALLYVNGVFIDDVTTTATDPLDPALVRFNLGSYRADAAANPYEGQIFDPRVFDRVLAAAEVGQLAAMAPNNNNTGPTDALLHYKCDEGAGTVARNSGTLGSSADGTITTASEALFHDESTNSVYSWQNERGYTAGTGANGADIGEFIPRDESDPTRDVAGNLLDYTGPAPHAAILSSPCGTFDVSENHYGVAGNAYPEGDIENLSVAAWIKTTAVSGLSFAVGQYEDDSGGGQQDRFFALGRSAGVTRAYFTDGGAGATIVTGAIPINDGEWHLIVATWDKADAGQQIKIYVDGVLDVTETRASISGNIHELTIGCGWDLKPVVSFGWDGQIADIYLYDDQTTLTPAEIATMWQTKQPITRGIKHHYVHTNGNVIHDIVGGNHAALTTAAEATFYGEQQNVTDTLTTDGATIATRYDGVNERYEHSGTLSQGGITAMTIAARFRKPIGTGGTIASEGATGWALYFSSGTNLRFRLYSGGDEDLDHTYANDGKWHTVVGVYRSDFSASLYVDNVEVATGSQLALSPVEDFAIGRLTGAGSYFNGMLSDVCWEQRDWSVGEVDDYEAGTVPTTCYRWRDGNGIESQQALPDLTGFGTPDRIIVPAGVLPVTVQPGILHPGQSLDLGGGEPNSPMAQQLAAILADLTYDQGDDNEADALFARVTADGEDRIATVIPAATGGELSALNAWSANP